MRRIILSSRNQHKVKEIKDILKYLPIEVISKNDVGLNEFDVVEDGETLEENSMKKAKELSELADGIIIADDTGLFVDALGGKPGVHSARYAGSDCSDENNNKLLLKNLENIPMEKRTAFFRTVISVVLENKESFTAEGVCYGKIGFESKGENGFGYDPLFIVDGVDKTFSEMSDEEKNSISHRSRALLNLREKLEEVISEDIGYK